MRRRVVVTGVGVITPVGNSAEQMWQSMCAGKSGIGPITHFDATGFPTQFAAEVRNFQLDQYVDDAKRFAYAGRNIRFAVGAAKQAMDDAAMASGSFDPSRFGVYLGAGEGQQDFTLVMSMIAES